MSKDSKESKSSQFLNIQQMISDEKSPCTPAEATRSKQGATKQKKEKEILYTKFISESDNLIRYCTRFNEIYSCMALCAHRLRSLYRRELQKVRKSEKSGASAEDVYVPTLWYFENMQFLRDQKIQLEGISSFDDCDDEEREPSIKRQKITEKDFLTKAVNFLDKSESNPKRDEASIYREAWAVAYRKLSEEQQLFAKKVIDDDCCYMAAWETLACHLL